MAQHSFEYDFVISYAGEDQEFAESLYQELTDRGAKVFYAPTKAVEIWGENQYEYLMDVYSKKGLFCIPVISIHYVRKAWTQHEWQSAQQRALESTNQKYILPIRLDQTELPGLLTTIGYLSTSEYSVENIANYAIEKLGLRSDGVEINFMSEEAVAPSKSWDYVNQPTQRNSYLSENNYVNRKSDNFAQNTWTEHLSDDYEETENRFMTLVAVPIPSSIDVDQEQTSSLFKFEEQPPGVGEHDIPSQWFTTANFNRISRTQNEHVRYQRFYRDPKQDTPRYIRWTATGALEYGVMPYVSFYRVDIGIHAFNFTFILGAAWKFAHLAAHVYKGVGYNEQFQLLVNLTNTRDSALAEFANEEDWPSLISQRHPNFVRYMLENGQGICLETNVQLVFNIDILRLNEELDDSETLMTELSRHLQISFNNKPDARHYPKNSTQFPWRKYYDYESLLMRIPG